MLNQLLIRDFAIIDRLELDFSSGMTTITGETGAGKSIAIDALGLALGGRADSSLVRHNCKRSEITAIFEIQQLPAVQSWLNEQELDEHGECILRRTISREGSSKAYINGRAVPLTMVRYLSEQLIDIHSQHQHQSLMRNDTQRQILDNYGQHQKLVASVKTTYTQWQKLNAEYNKIKSGVSERAARIDFLQFQIDELDALELSENEWPSLETEHKQLANVENIQLGVNQAIDILYLDENAVASRLTKVTQTLIPLIEFVPDLKNTIATLESATINIDESIIELKHKVDDGQFDTSRFAEIENRLSVLHNSARKHHCEARELPGVLSKLKNELSPLLNAENNLDALQIEMEKAIECYQTSALQLSTRRKKAASKLKRACEKILASLGMQCEFEAQLHAINDNTYSISGNEHVLFAISTNPGTPLKAIAKIASGGELSRISLAIQVVTSQVTEIPTMFFDEVDVGIGGSTAEVVGRLLNDLSKNKQIVCITHQAQVAAQGDTHWLVEKQKSRKQVNTQIINLEDEEREIEIARMIGGITMTNTTREHAREMLQKQ